MLLDTPLRLCYGAGDGKTEACLMTATNMLIGQPEQEDKAVCVCPTLRGFIITTNDGMPGELRQLLYGDLPWEIIGTRTDDKEAMADRLAVFQRLAEKCQAALTAFGYRVNGKFRGDVTDLANETMLISRSLRSGRVSSDSNLAWPGDMAALIVSTTVDIIDSSSPNTTAEDRACSIQTVWGWCREAILEICAIGDKRPVETVMSVEEMVAALNH